MSPMQLQCFIFFIMTISCMDLNQFLIAVRVLFLHFFQGN